MKSDGPVLALPDGRGPAYRRLADAVVTEIERGRLKPGDRLPGTRKLATALGLHRNTVLAAWRELLSQGWIRARTGAATTVAPLPPSVPRARRPAGQPPFEVPPVQPPALAPPTPPGTLVLAGGRPDLRALPTAEIARAWRAAIRDTRGRVLDYGDPAGHPRLRAALAGWLAAERGLAADDLVITRGAQQALFLVARALIRPGDRVAVEVLGYPPAWAALRAAGAELVPIEVDEGGMRIDGVEDAARHGLRAVYCTPHHQFPTMVTMPAGRRLALLALAVRHRLAVIEDDYDAEFHYAGRPVLPLAAIDRAAAVVSVGTLSKTLAPGLRTGFVSAAPVVREAVVAARIAVDRQGDPATELAVATLIEDGTFRRHLRRMRRTYAARQQVVARLLRERLGDVLRFEVPMGGLALWVRSDADVDRWAERALARGVGFDTAARYHLLGERLPYLRVGFASLDEGELEMAVDRMRAALHDRQARSKRTPRPT